MGHWLAEVCRWFLEWRLVIPGVVGYIFVDTSMLLAVLTAAVILLRLERRPFSDLGLSLKGHASGLWYGLLMAILLHLLGFGISVVLGEIEVTGFQFKPLDLLGSGVFPVSGVV